MIQIIKGSCGSGKTTSFIKNRLGFIERPVLYVCPSKPAVKEIHDLIQKHTEKSVIAIDSDHCGANVKETLQRYLKDETKNVVVCTIQMFEQIPPNRYLTHQVVVDDPLPLVSGITLVDSNELNLINTYFENNEGYLLPKNLNLLKKLSRNSTSNIKTYVSGILDVMLRIESGKLKLKLVKKDTSSNTGIVSYSCAIEPSNTYFPSDAILLGEDADIHEFVVLHCPKVKVDNIETETSDRPVTISFYMEENNSRYFKEKYNNDYNTIVETIKRKSGDTDTLLLNNKSYGLFEHNWTELPVNSHSLNTYQHVSNVVITKTTNFETTYRKYVEDTYGVGYADNRVSANVFYQAVMRCSLRDRKSKDPVSIHCVDQKTAELLYCKLSSSFNNVKLNKIEVEFEARNNKSTGRKKLWSNTTERVKANNIIKKAKAGFYMPMVNTKILSMVKNDKKHEIVKLSIWEKLNTNGGFKQT